MIAQFQTHITHKLVRRIARHLMYPPTTITPALTVTDKDAWVQVIDRSNNSQRLSMLVALHDRLLDATSGGNMRLRLYHGQGAPVRISDTVLAEGRDVELLLFGDESFLSVIQQAAALCPPVVRAAVAREVAFLAVGLNSKAFTCSGVLAGYDAIRKLRLVVLGPEVTLFDVVHEIGHCWTSATVERPATSVQGSLALRALCDRQVPPSFGRYLPGRRLANALDRDRQLDEDIADALALCWALRTTGSVS